jgi:hypothetical protein
MMLVPLLFRELESAVAPFSSELRSLLALGTTIDDAKFTEAKEQQRSVPRNLFRMFQFFPSGSPLP